MTADLSALPQHVREAVELFDIDAEKGARYTRHDDWQTIRAELLRVTGECERRHRMCIDRSQELLRLVRESGELQERAERAESELAALRKRVAEAPVGNIVAGRANSFGGFHVEVATNSGWYSGQRVALLTVIDEDKA